MAKHRRSNVGQAHSRDSQPAAATRRRSPPVPVGPPLAPGTREINAAPMLEHAVPGIDTKGRMTVARAIALIGVALHASMPAVLSWGLVMSLIFGGCCSNVFTLEAIVKEVPESGLLITLIQFLVTVLFTLPSFLVLEKRPWLLKRRAVPFCRWIPGILLYFTISMMNNFAFSYNISVPVHIILRSGGSVTTMLVGSFWGKRYTKGQVFGVAMLTAGVIIAALSDAQSKGKTSSSTYSSLPGFLILFIAQILSSIMGLYVQNTYAIYGPHWYENLFYSHFLSLPLFIPFIPALRQQLASLLSSPPTPLSASLSERLYSNMSSPYLSPMDPLQISTKLRSFDQIPANLVYLAANALTQYACIRGVNLLGSRTSALGVTVVLNVRKLISLFASIWLFGNELPPGVLVGAAVVFTGAAVYGSAGSRVENRVGTRAKAEQLGQPREAEKPADRSVSKAKVG